MAGLTYSFMRLSSSQEGLSHQETIVVYSFLCVWRCSCMRIWRQMLEMHGAYITPSNVAMRFPQNATSLHVKDHTSTPTISYMPCGSLPAKASTGLGGSPLQQIARANLRVAGRLFWGIGAGRTSTRSPSESWRCCSWRCCTRTLRRSDD